ncbi:D-alanyl-D-alanine carboxypeptidase/D-alanyl-D-alanine-endopeptidase [Deefgea tanakiae]|uniref:D-alanyl-D-alanine carboxypeptidase/D-alanyl-D-alanine-endopeptidase n=1 Tax=Deefgea tanakiae TaxID=2865840 RepID=A0ABX8Z7J7_9NEIS|nr:D-alanyl-D-alanine carboxypeptidase/D-alanyl-D-alanine-endopeptidase [Deefgea tanakiae]QZA78370.1 D-alanyl-D-alanine carboxypeptidase/D-alanyl-D-alanine-endopeptidase [Deefgea tanakiae]
MRSLITFIALAVSSSIAIAADSLPSNVSNALKAAKIPNDALSVAMVPLDAQGKPQFYRADVPSNPASTMKIVTTYAGLEILGPAWQWQTEIRANALPKNGVLDGDIYLKGSGDPKLTLERMWLLVRDLKAAGVDEIRGNVVLDRSAFVIDANEPAFDDDGETSDRPFMVKPDALLTNFKSLRVRVRADGERVIASVEPDWPEVRFSNQLGLGAAAPCETWQKRVQFRTGQATPQFMLQLVGEVPAGCIGEKYMSVFDAPTYTYLLFRNLWLAEGGKLGGKMQQGITPANSVLLASTKSSDMVSTIRDINKYSNNMMARQLFLTIGATQGAAADGATTASRSTAVIQRWLQSKGKRFDELVLENGAGLSRKEQISARHLAELLQDAWNAPLAAEFVSSLPLVGIDGTMKKRLKDESSIGQGHIKTGTLKDVRAVAGYVRDANGKTWAVVGIINHANAPAGMATLDELLKSIRKTTN